MDNTMINKAKEAKHEAIINFLNDMSGSDLIDLWNEYCDNNSMGDDFIYTNDEYTINDMFNTAYDIVSAISYGDYNMNHDYFKFNGYGNLESFYETNAIDHIDVDALADYVAENGCDNIDLTEDFVDFVNDSGIIDFTITESDVKYQYDTVIDEWDEIIDDIISDYENDDEDDED